MNIENFHEQNSKETGLNKSFENSQKDKKMNKVQSSQGNAYSIRPKEENSKQQEEKKEDKGLSMSKSDHRDTSVLRKLLFKMKLRDQMKRVIERTFPGRSFHHQKEYCHFLNDKASDYCQEQYRCTIDKMQNLYAKANIQNVLKYNEQMQAKYKQELLQKKQKYLYIKEKVMNFFLNFPVFAPSHSYKLMWDLLINVNCILIMFFLPISFLYDIPMTNLLGDPLKTLIPILLLLDLLVNFNTGFFSQGQICKSRSKIFLQFLKKNWFSDLIPLALFLVNYINFMLIEDNSITAKIVRLIQFLFFTRISQLLKVLHTVEDTASLNPRAVNIIQLFQVLILILFVSHLFASAWLFLGMNSSYSQSKLTWLYYREIENSDWTIQYLSSYYFATVTMITVGYGDITPQNPQEMLFCVLSMMICCGVFAYSINQIGNIFKQFFRFEDELKENMKVINNYMKNKKVNQDLQYQVRQYLDYYWREESQQDVQQESRIINQLSDGLRETLLMEANKIALIDSPIFRDNFSNQVIAKTVPLIKEMRFTPEEIIFDEEKIDSLEGSIYFIEKGKVEICSYYAHPIVKKQQMINRIIELKSGDSFGEISFFTGKRRAFSVRSLEFCRMLVIRRNDFIQLLQEYPDDYEKFCMIKDDILMSNNTSSIATKCYACKATNHLISECHFSHFIPNKKRIILQESRGINQKRTDRSRRKKSQYYDLSELTEGALKVLECCKEIIIENYDFYYENSSELDSPDENLDQVLDIKNQQATQNNQIQVKRKASQLLFTHSLNHSKSGSQFTIKQDPSPKNLEQQNLVYQHQGFSDAFDQIEAKCESNNTIIYKQQEGSQINASSKVLPFPENIGHKPHLRKARGSVKINSQNLIKNHNNEDQGESMITNEQQQFADSSKSKQNLLTEDQSYQYSSFYKYGSQQPGNKPQPGNNLYLILKQNPQLQMQYSNSQISSQQVIGQAFQKRSSIENNFSIEPEILEQSILRQQRKKATQNMHQQAMVVRSGTNIKSLYESSQNRDYGLYQHLIEAMHRNNIHVHEMNVELITESIRNYTIYFPHNNAPNVIQKLQKSALKKEEIDLQKKGTFSQRKTFLKIINKVSDNLQLLRKKSIFSLRQSTLNNGDQTGMSSPHQIQRFQNDSFNKSQSGLSKQSKGLGYNSMLKEDSKFNISESKEREKTQDSSQDFSQLSHEISINQSGQFIKFDFMNEKQTIQYTDQSIPKEQQPHTIPSKQEIPQKNINIFQLNKRTALSHYTPDKI